MTVVGSSERPSARHLGAGAEYRCAWFDTSHALHEDLFFGSTLVEVKL
jgi:hypothetical protein